MSRIWPVCLFLLFAPGTVPATERGPEPETTPPVTATVWRVVDGDTIHLTDASGRVTKVRLFGIDAPELRDRPAGQQARVALQDIVAGQTAITCRHVDTDRYDRFVGLCRIVATGHDLSVTMLRRGMARTYDRFLHLADPADREALVAAQQHAMHSRAGLWQNSYWQGTAWRCTTWQPLDGHVLPPRDGTTSE